jgi:hypothetical protein
MIRRRAGVFNIIPFDLKSTDVGFDSPATPLPLMHNAEEAFADYNDFRREHDAAPIYASTENMKRLIELVDWLRDTGVTFVDYLKFAYANTEFLRKKGVKVPSLELLCGEWCRNQFTTERGTQVEPTQHAGKKYDSVDGIRAKMLAAGLKSARTMSKADIRFVMESAENMIHDPRRFGTPPEDLQDEVLWMKRQLESGEIRAAS